MLTLYENIKKIRKQNGWTQEDLAKRMGYTDRSMIAKIEAGKVDLSQSKIVEFAKVFNVDPGDLMGWEGTTSINYEDGIKERALHYFKLYQNAPPEIRQAVDSILKSSQPKP